MAKTKISNNKSKKVRTWLIKNRSSIYIYTLVIIFYLSLLLILFPKKSIRENTQPISTNMQIQKAFAQLELDNSTLPANIPLRLFDVVLSVESPVIEKSNSLIARTEFTSFGTVPTLVKQNYKVEDSDRKVLFDETVETIVETEKIVTKTFPDLNIKDGKYTLILTTTYGQNVVDEFRQTFEVKTPSYTWLISSIILIFTIIIGYSTITQISKNKKEFMRL